MEARLLARDYSRFAACWNEVDGATAAVFPIHPQVKVRLGSGQGNFVIHMVELLQLDRLIYLAYFEPDEETREFCKANLSHLIGDGRSCLKAINP